MSGEAPAPLSLFSGYGIELEYMIVDANSHDVAPICDELLKREAGDYVNEIEDGPIAWSNELVLHVVELKTNGPAPSLVKLPELFLADVGRVNTHLAEFNARLMPTAAHPWMDPMRETRLWPHESNEIYDAYNRIFDCRGHGWSNLQSMHVNLPFADDAEFNLLHAAIRALLPVMPALAASSPILDWQHTGMMDTRLEFYRHNAGRIPAITGKVVPETALSRAQYEAVILAPMYEAIHTHDPDRILQHEWLNSRGAIARFDRNAIEIRVLDTQETPAADIAVAALICGTLRALTASTWADAGRLHELETERLAAILLEVIRDADEAVIRDTDYLGIFRFPERTASARELWQHLLESNPAAESELDGEARRITGVILREGCLARRILRATGKECRRSHVRETWRVLCECLAAGTLFEGID